MLSVGLSFWVASKKGVTSKDEEEAGAVKVNKARSISRVRSPPASRPAQGFVLPSAHRPLATCSKSVKPPRDLHRRLHQIRVRLARRILLCQWHGRAIYDSGSGVICKRRLNEPRARNHARGWEEGARKGGHGDMFTVAGSAGEEEVLMSWIGVMRKK